MRMKKAADSTGRKAYLFLLLIAVIFFMTLSCKPDQLAQAIERVLGVPVPELSLEAGIYGSDIVVEIINNLDGAAIYYTLTGEDPTAESNAYEGPIELKGDGLEVTLKAIAAFTDMQNSPVVEAKFKIEYAKTAAPEFSLVPGTYAEDIALELTCETGDAVIYYTDDGSQLSTNSKVYTPGVPIQISGHGASKIISAFAVRDRLKESEITGGSFTVDYERVADPTFNLTPGAYSYDLDIELSCTTSGATIYYTDDYTFPTTSSIEYTGTPIPLAGDSQSIVVNAFAVKDGLESSDKIQGIFTTNYSLKEIGNFDFLAADNPELSGDYNCTVSQVSDTISVELPFATKLSDLVPSITSNAGSITVAGAPQASGVTPQDFKQVVTYRAYAPAPDDASYTDYTVSVTYPQPQVAIFGGTGQDSTSRVAVDGSNNVYCAIQFSDTVDVDPGSGVTNLTSAGNSDIGVVKLDSAGNYIWSGRWGNSRADSPELPYDIDVVGSYFYVSSRLRNTCDLDPGAGSFSPSAFGNYDAAVSKFQLDGTFVHAVRGYDVHSQYIRGISIDSSENIYIAGHYGDDNENQSIDLDPTAGEDPHSVRDSGLGFQNDCFISRWNSDWSYGWTRSWGGAENDYGYDNALGPDSGDLYSVGVFQLTDIDFNEDPGPADVNTHSSNGSYDVSITRRGTDASYDWTITYGGTGSDYGFEIITDASENLYVVGRFENTVDFDPGAGTDSHTSAGETDGYISKFNSSGTHQWTRTFGSTLSDQATGVALDGSGNLYITGHFRGTVDFDPSGTDNHTAAGDSDVFVTKYDTNGNYDYTITFGGTDLDSGSRLAVDGNGRVYVCGFFTGTADFDPSVGVYNITSAGDRDIFLYSFTD